VTTISKLPFGLLGFLGIKNGGQYPGVLGDTLLPVFPEILPLICASWAEEIHTASGTTAAGPGNFQTFNTALQVPQGECWYVYLLSVRVATGAGETISGNLQLRRANAAALNNSIAVMEQISQIASFTSSYRAQATPFFMGPGDELGFWIAAASGAGPTVRPDIRFLRFQL